MYGLKFAAPHMRTIVDKLPEPLDSQIVLPGDRQRRSKAGIEKRLTANAAACKRYKDKRKRSGLKRDPPRTETHLIDSDRRNKLHQREASLRTTYMREASRGSTLAEPPPPPTKFVWSDSDSTQACSARQARRQKISDARHNGRFSIGNGPSLGYGHGRLEESAIQPAAWVIVYNPVRKVVVCPTLGEPWV